MVKILDCNCVSNLWQNVIEYMFPLFCMQAFLLLDIQVLNHYVFAVQYFRQWLNYNNLWKIGTC